jgi:hypothetical protein
MYRPMGGVLVRLVISGDERVQRVNGNARSRERRREPKEGDSTTIGFCASPNSCP